MRKLNSSYRKDRSIASRPQRGPSRIGLALAGLLAALAVGILTLSDARLQLPESEDTAGLDIVNHRDSFANYGTAADELDLPEGAETASVISFSDNLLSQTGWDTSGCAIGQSLWRHQSIPLAGASTVLTGVTPPYYWYGNTPPLDPKLDLPPKEGPCPALDPPCWRCNNRFPPDPIQGDLCAFGGSGHCGNLSSPRISLFNVPPPIKLEFQSCLDNSPAVQRTARVEIAVNGGEYTMLKQITVGGCRKETIDLSDYSNAVVQLRFFFALPGISSFATNNYGWVVDDVKVIGGFGSNPTSAPNPKSRLYVADTHNHRISVWQYEAGSGIAPAVTHFKNFGAYGTANNRFNSPEDVTVGPNGRIYVADTGNHRILVFDDDGNALQQYGSYGTADGKFNSPSGIAASGWEYTPATNKPKHFYLYVADTLNHRVQRFRVSHAGNTITHDGKTGPYGVADGRFNSPEGIDVDPIDTPGFTAPPPMQLPTTPEQWKGRVYVTDALNHRLQVLSLKGIFSTKTGAYGTANDRFNSPQDVSVGIRLSAVSATAKKQYDILAADTGNHRVKLWRFQTDSGTAPIFGAPEIFGSYGTADARFSRPNGLAAGRAPQKDMLPTQKDSVGIDDEFFVIDTLNHRGQRFERP